jgi:hypothetical protein
VEARAAENVLELAQQLVDRPSLLPGELHELADLAAQSVSSLAAHVAGLILVLHGVLGRPLPGGTW